MHENLPGSDRQFCIWHPPVNYVLVVKERYGGFFLVTSYCPEPKRKMDFHREWVTAKIRVHSCPFAVKSGRRTGGFPVPVFEYRVRLLCGFAPLQLYHGPLALRLAGYRPLISANSF